MREFIPHLSPISEIWVAKLLGAIAGSAISLAYVLPKGKREAAARFLTGISAGIVFGLPVGHWLAQYVGISESLDEFELALMGSAFASLSIWTALGVAVRLTRRRFPPASPQGSTENGGDKHEQR